MGQFVRSHLQPVRVSLDDMLVLLGREIADVAAAVTAEFGREHQIGAALKPAKGK